MYSINYFLLVWNGGYIPQPFLPKQSFLLLTTDKTQGVEENNDKEEEVGNKLEGQMLEEYASFNFLKM
jgi:hypothetical protein